MGGMMARKPKHPKPTPEQIAAETARKAEQEARWQVARRRAARIIRDHGAPLFAVDVINPWSLAEAQAESAHRIRLEVVAGLIEFGGAVPETDLMALVHGEGTHGSDRMTAIWWDGLSWTRVLGGIQSPDGKGALRLMMPLEDLVDAGVVRREALTIIRGAPKDPWAARRTEERERLARFLEEVATLAAECED